MAKTQTHNEWLLRPPPGARFVNWEGGDVKLQFERGREAEILTWLRGWIDQYIAPEVENSTLERQGDDLEQIAQVAAVIATHQPATPAQVVAAHMGPAVTPPRPDLKAPSGQAHVNANGPCQATTVYYNAKKQCELGLNHEYSHQFRDENGAKINFVLPGESPGV